MPRTRIMVVDDHEVVRSGLKAILEPEGFDQTLDEDQAVDSKAASLDE